MLRGQPRSGGTGRGAPTEVWRGWRRLAVMLAGGVVAIAGLGACNSADADPEPDPTTPVAPEPEPAGGDDESADDQSGGSADEPPGPQDYEHPEPGEDIDDEGQAGAEAAAVYFVELNSYVYATGEFEAWDELTAEDCEFCAVVRDRANEIYETDGYAVTRPPTIRSASAQLDPATSGSYVVEVDFHDAEVEIIDSAGESAGGYAAAETHAWILVELRDGEWSVLEAEGQVAE